MKTLAIGFIGAALTLALAAPSWAHVPLIKVPSLTFAGKDTCHHHRHHMTHHTRGGPGSSGDNSANTLNAQELSRVQGGGAPALAPMPPGR